MKVIVIQYALCYTMHKVKSNQKWNQRGEYNVEEGS